MTPPIDIRADHLRIVQDVLRRHLPDGVKVWVFGSRTSWTTKDSSDLDLALEAANSIPPRSLSALEAAFEDSDLPYTVDVVDVKRIREAFGRVVAKQRVSLMTTGHARSGYWLTATIEEVSLKVAMGPFGSSIKVSTFVPDGVPIISGQHLHGIRLDDSPGFNFITQEHARRLASANVERGDVIFTHAGNIGQVAYIPQDSAFARYVISQRQFYVRCDNSRVIPEFVALYFASPEGRHQLLANTSQVGVPSIAQPVTYLRTLEIPLPALPEQRAIAHILGTVDDKIELNRRMNATLEAMARALFRSWFVDFDPVRAKMEGRDTGLPKDIADLFPDRLVESELGEIPEGWKVKPLEAFGEIVTGKTPSTRVPSHFGDEVPFLRIPDMHGKMYVLQTQMMLSNRGASSQYRKTLPHGSVSVSCIATPGLVVLNHRPTQTNQQINSIVPKNEAHGRYLYWLCRRLSSAVKTSGAGGSVLANMNKTAFCALLAVYGGSNVIRAFDEAVAPMHTSILANEIESRTLGQVRDALLPKLVSGELRVTGAQAVGPTDRER